MGLIDILAVCAFFTLPMMLIILVYALIKLLHMIDDEVTKDIQEIENRINTDPDDEKEVD